MRKMYEYGKFSRQKPREKELSKIREKIHDMFLYHREPGSKAAKKSDDFDAFWDTLINISLSYDFMVAKNIFSKIALH